MSLYNALFGVNELSGALLKCAGLTTATVGRFRDVWIEQGGSGEPVIVVHTRNGGGNRDCWHTDGGGSERCAHHDEVRNEKEYVEVTEAEAKERGYQLLNVFIGGTKRGAYTGRMVDVTHHICDAPDSAQCACPGCTITYAAEKFPNFLGSEDDDFDCTYANMSFSPLPEWRDAAMVLASTSEPVNTREQWDALLSALKNGGAR